MTRLTKLPSASAFFLLLAKSRVENASVKAAFARIVRRAVPAQVLAQVIAEGVQATETKFFQHKGKVMDQREVIAWGPRSSFAKIAAEYGGYVEPDRGVSDSTQIEVLVRFIGEA